MKKNGFSLIETLVALAIVSIMGIILADLLTRTIQGGNKTHLIGTMKDNGQAALNIIESSMRSSDTVICPINTGDPLDLPSETAKRLPNVLVVSQNGIYTRFGFVDTTPPLSTGQNGYISKDHPAVSDTTDLMAINKLCEFLPGTYAAGQGGSATATTEQLLTDQTLVSVVQNSGLFFKSHAPGYKDEVTIQFTLTPGVVSTKASGQVGTNNQIPFSDTIELQ